MGGWDVLAWVADSVGVVSVGDSSEDCEWSG